MLRLLLFILLSAASSVALADVPSLFEPAEKDVSLYYLGVLFGSQLIAGAPDMHLMSYVFEVFNQVCLSVGMIIVIYTLITGSLYTAGQGKVLGEKWNAVWMPIRMVLGISLLVPKAGSGYCIAQYTVMWLVVQGIGGADTLWSKTLDYFIEGGTLRSETADYSSSYMTKTNLDATYNLERYILMNTACVSAHNNSEYKDVFGAYKIYHSDDYKYLNFGNEKAWDPELGGDGGRECGYMEMPSNQCVGCIGDSPEQEEIIRQTYAYAFENMARGLNELSDFMATEGGSNGDAWSGYYDIMQINAVTFLETLKGAHDILYPNMESDQSNDRKNLENLKDYGWILAGNYYMTLASFSDNLDGIVLDMTMLPDTLIKEPISDSYERYGYAIKNAEDFWQTAPSDPRFDQSFVNWDEKYHLEGYPALVEGAPDPESHYRLTREELGNIKDNVKQLASMDGSGIETMKPVYYMEQITGFTGGDATNADSKLGVRDPIIHAAKFGKKLTEIAVGMVIAATGLYLILAIGVMKMGPQACVAGKYSFIVMILVVLSAPIIFGIAGFLYAQGVMLGVLLPLIVFVTFLIGALGWYISVVTSVVAAPLVAIGLIFPETKDEIWGRAEPAYMMILNLFLRPSLMIIGFVAGMVLAWVAVELLNTAFYLFLKDAVHIENMLFGYIVVTTTYIGLMLYVVEKAFSLINELPNTVLLWIGDRSQAQEGAREILGAARGGVEKGGAAVGSAMATGGQTAGKAAEMLMKKGQDDNTALAAKGGKIKTT